MRLERTERWRPTLGAWCEGDAARFRVWAPKKRRVEVVLETAGRAGAEFPLEKAADGVFSGLVPGIGDGDRYRYRLDGEGPFPDPASRFQPDGVHGPSQIVDPDRFRWSDASWQGVPLQDLVVYELHVGTFTSAGSFDGVTERLPYLRDLGVTALEVMPVADFPATRNWGYDGVALFAPARCYGSPDDLRRLVDTAHQLGLGVVMDVVYNHLGPDGAYLAAFSPYYFSKRHRTPWGAAINLDGPHSDKVREYFTENAAHWIHEYHVDALRLDATHALIDDSPRHFLADLASRIHASAALKSKALASERVLLIAEDHRNLATIVRPESQGGWGLDAVWADDFHHQVRCSLAGDNEGYFRDFSGSASDLAATIQQGWFYCGQHAQTFGASRGTDPAGIAPRRFVICLQNHDQVGNRALGDRLHHTVDLAAFRAATVLLLCAPQTPLLFMGQEWAASSPFLFFTDHNPQLGKLVTRGRRQEFKDFSAFSDAKVRESIPDPQARDTFLRSQLDWQECSREPHTSTFRLYRALLRLRGAEPSLRCDRADAFDAVAVNDNALVLHRWAPEAAPLAVVVQLHGAGSVTVQQSSRIRLARGEESEDANGSWEQVLSTEDPELNADAKPVRVDLSDPGPLLYFARPGAVIFRHDSAR